MRQVILLIMLLCSSSLIFSQKKLNNVEVENMVEFYTDSVISNPPQDIISFTLKVTNNTNEPIPDLGVTNRSKNVNFYINGKMDNPMSLYNGLEAINGDKTIPKNESQTCGASWTIMPTTGLIVKYGNKFTVQWEYMGKRSALLQVDVEKKEAYIIRQCLIAQ